MRNLSPRAVVMVGEFGGLVLLSVKPPTSTKSFPYSFKLLLYYSPLPVSNELSTINQTTLNAAAEGA